MRKSIIKAFVLGGFSAAVLGMPGYAKACQYTVLQNLIRDARSHEQIFDMIRAGVSMDDETITCGGSLLQLAIRRGNPSIVNGILTQDKSRANRDVSLSGYAIPGAPDSIPVIMFAAYYAPSEVVFKVLTEMGADVTVRDKVGHGILWYMDQNPVLRQTTTEDVVKQTLQNRVLEDARKNSQRQMGQQPPVVLNEVPNQTPQQLASPTVSDSTLAMPIDPKPVQPTGIR